MAIWYVIRLSDSATLSSSPNEELAVKMAAFLNEGSTKPTAAVFARQLKVKKPVKFEPNPATPGVLHGRRTRRNKQG